MSIGRDRVVTITTAVLTELNRVQDREADLARIERDNEFQAEIAALHAQGDGLFYAYKLLADELGWANPTQGETT